MGERGQSFHISKAAGNILHLNPEQNNSLMFIPHALAILPGSDSYVMKNTLKHNNAFEPKESFTTEHTFPKKKCLIRFTYITLTKVNHGVKAK